MKARLRQLAVIVFTLGVTLAVGEFFLRIFAPLHLVGYQGAYVYDQDLGYRIRPSIHHLQLTDYQQEIRTNGLGTVNFQESFDLYNRLVFAIGDSYTQGTGLPADASYPFQLDLMLNVRKGKYETEFGVVNLGLAAFGLEQSMVALERFATKLGRPNFVLFLACRNDLNDDKLYLSGYRHNSLVDGSPRYGIWTAPLQWITYKFEIGKRMKQVVSRIRRGNIGVATPAASEDSASRNLIAPQRERLERLLAQTRRYGAQLVVSFADWESVGDGNYEWLLEWARNNGVGFADWRARALTISRAVPNLPISNPHSGSHHRSWVNRVIAESFGDAILSGDI